MDKNKKYKQSPGEINFITYQEEEEILSHLKKARESSSNSQIYGQNGEIPLRNYLKSHLPNVFRVETGHFINEKGEISPQIDIMILDSRFPLINVNADQSVLVPGHSVIACISVKSTANKKEIAEIITSARKIRSLTNQIFDSESWDSCILFGFCYTSSLSHNSICNHYFNFSEKENPHVDVTIMRNKNKTEMSRVGYRLHWEPGYDNNNKYIPLSIDTNSPLSDLFYEILQESYYTLHSRKINLKKLGELTMKYFTWGSIAEEYKDKLE